MGMGSRLLRLPADNPTMATDVWDWSRSNPKPFYFSAGEIVPCTMKRAQAPIYVNPIMATEKGVPVGGICLIQDSLFLEDTTIDLGPTLQVLAAQIGTALHQAEVQAQMLAHQKSVQELEFAWNIQESFLPEALPEIEGWQLAAALNPCQETSGDFYDVISLPNGRLGIVIADVADKGMGGDTLIMYTDGVTEAQNERDAFFGDIGLLTAARENLNGSGLAVKSAVLAAVEEFSGAGVQCDDETLVVVKRGQQIAVNNQESTIEG